MHFEDMVGCVTELLRWLDRRSRERWLSSARSLLGVYNTYLLMSVPRRRI